MRQPPGTRSARVVDSAIGMSLPASPCPEARTSPDVAQSRIRWPNGWPKRARSAPSPTQYRCMLVDKAVAGANRASGAARGHPGEVEAETAELDRRGSQQPAAVAQLGEVVARVDAGGVVGRGALAEAGEELVGEERRVVVEMRVEDSGFVHGGTVRPGGVSAHRRDAPSAMDGRWSVCPIDRSRERRRGAHMLHPCPTVTRCGEWSTGWPGAGAALRRSGARTSGDSRPCWLRTDRPSCSCTAPPGSERACSSMPWSPRPAGAAIRLDARRVEPTPTAFLEASSAAIGTRPRLRRAGRCHAADGFSLLVIDGYERLRLIDDWIRDHLVPALPAPSTTVLVTRTPPNAAWRTGEWRQLATRSRSARCPSTTRLTLVEQRIGRGAATEQVLRFGRGHPLALHLAADAVAGGPT